jgi:hypothetical protein
MYRIIAVHFIAAIGVIVTDTVVESHGNLDGVGTIGPGVVIPASTSSIQFTPIQRKDSAIRCSRGGGAAFGCQNTDLLDWTDGTTTC